MRDYVAPLQDTRFAMDHVADGASIAKLEGFGSSDPATLSQLLEGGARFYQEAWAPTNRAADVSGAHLRDGRVVVHEAFHEAYRRTMEGGWNVLPRPPADGEDGVPWLATPRSSNSARRATAACPC